MKITYLAHSGFLVELNSCYLVFDYYQGTLPELDTEKPVLVFASHRHPDHYHPQIFDLLKAQGFSDEAVFAVLSSDIYRKKIPDGLSFQQVKPHQEYELPCHLKLKTLRSTDEGVAFVLYTAEGNLYHAGDLNDWIWEGESTAYNHDMTARYRREIDRLKGISFAAAFIPLDPRQEHDYDKGILYFLETVTAHYVFPMHYWEKPEIIKRFLTEHPAYRTVIQDTEALKKGQIYEL